MVSIIIPCYNVEDFIDECIGSILEQDFTDIEVLAIDDGSGDATGAKLDTWAQKDSRMRVFHTKNAGVSAARNLGIEQSRGDFLTFIDSDDSIKPNYISTLYEAIIENNADYSQVSQYCNILGTNDYRYIPAVSQIEVYKGYEQYVEDIYLDKNKTMFVSGIVACMKLYRRELFENVRFPIGRRMEDCWVFPELAIQCKKIVVCPDCLYFYRQREQSTTRVLSSKVVEAKMEAWLHNREWWREHPGTDHERLVAATEKYLCHYMYKNAHVVSTERSDYFKKQYSKMVKHILLTKYLSLKTKIKYLTFASPILVWRRKSTN